MNRLTYFVLICLLIPFATLSLVGCNGRKNLYSTMKYLTISVNYYEAEHGALPYDESGQGFALYKLRANRQTDEFCEICLPPFEWDDANLSVTDQTVYYANLTPEDLDRAARDTIILVAMRENDLRTVYAVDRQFRIYTLTGQGSTPLDYKQLLGVSHSSITSSWNTTLVEEIPKALTETM